ncbi:hypothetical protein NPIL_448331 [Nephila pilipes]|uniref:Uncharacterized protein n=1 Tax=Nephila pilipes TaxID=299642 RepID=A0A8X6IKQ0_NEPPI|nr:hypothetical protein NPIL_448331 [Nephila pilipes]
MEKTRKNYNIRSDKARSDGKVDQGYDVLLRIQRPSLSQPQNDVPPQTLARVQKRKFRHSNIPKAYSIQFIPWFGVLSLMALLSYVNKGDEETTCE